jgi:serine phosphatase RsbU (regulator of sigma subunit)/anti-sigma regulatory factor (Ser/Thr protein kinase)
MEQAHGVASAPGPTVFDDAWRREGLHFRRRLTVAASVALVVLVGIAATLAWRQYQDGQRRALGDAHARVVLAAGLIDAAFSGDVSVLTATAAAPAVVAENTAAMRPYFRRVSPPGKQPFNGGVGWIDVNGNSRVSSNATRLTKVLNVADRAYFREVMATGKSYISEGLTSRGSHQQIIVIAVPTHDAAGHLSGVLAGALVVTPTSNAKSTADLGFQGLALLDRANQSVYAGLTHPTNTALLVRMGKQSVGTFSDSKGLDGRSGHVVAYATATLPQWKIIIDRPRSAVFAAARRGLVIDLVSIGVAALVIVTLFSWILMRARREEDKENERVRQWNELTHTLGGASAAKDVADALVAAIAAAFPGAQTLVALEVEDRLGLVVGSPPADGTRPIAGADEFVLLQVAKLAYGARSPIALEDEATLSERYPGIYNALHGRVRSLYAVPLVIRDGHRVGALSLVFSDERTLGEPERRLVAAQAEQAAQAVLRASVFEREHEVAVRLQRSLLSEELPETDTVDIAARYHAGSAGLQVGGDWFDAVRRPDGIIHFSVGDVAGRGLVAAGLMGHLRNAFRAYAYDQTSPAEIVRRLTRHVADDEMATTVCITVDPYTRELAYASAGHPPTLMRGGADGAVTRLAESSSPPLGFAQPTGVAETRLILPEHATFIAYTDGLVERRELGIESGIVLLESLLASAPALDADGLADLVLDEVVARRGIDDDIALLVASVAEVPARMEIEIPAHPAMLVGMRRRIQAWLTLRGLSEDERADIVLAVSEACNNAVEHAYEQNEGTIRLVLEHDADLLEITVQDFGKWRPAQPSYERGRGTSIMKSLMDDAEVLHDHRGTHVTLARRLTRIS